MKAGDSYDVIIVGGGSAGCVLASRLSEDPSRRVLLLESGPDPQPMPEMVAQATLQSQLLLESPYVEMYPAPRSIDGSISYNLAGRLMGGGSSINMMATPRPMRHDLDTWASLGNPDWSYDRCLPLLKRIESDQDFLDSPIHGSSGPLYMKRPWTFEMPASEPVSAFIERAQEMGMPLCPDLNGPDPFGVCPSPYGIRDGIRQSTTLAYLDPARRRPNLNIVSEATVRSLKLAGSRATGVVYQKEGKLHQATGDEVVLSAGAFRTPQLLLLSGIGPEAELKRLDVPVVDALEGVGANYQDHPLVTMTFEGPSDFPEDWVVPRFRLVWKSDSSRPCGNFHLMMRPPTEVPGLKRMLPVAAFLIEQRNRGQLSLASADPEDQPVVNSRLLEDPADIAAMRAAMQFLYDLVQDRSMRGYYGPLITPGAKEDWETFARSSYTSYQHGSGTCLMGPASNPMAVVDQELRVHGIDNLRVADASIMPTVAHANTNVTVIMIAERASDLIQKAQA